MVIQNISSGPEVRSWHSTLGDKKRHSRVPCDLKGLPWWFSDKESPCNAGEGINGISESRVFSVFVSEVGFLKK